MARMRNGLETLLAGGPGSVGLPPGARVALVVHPASVDASVVHAADRIRRDPRWSLVRLLAPEHGLRGEAQDMEGIEDAVDAATGLPIRSLYGHDASTLAPRPADLADVDAVIYDLQDVGSRYYTFVYTLSHVMEAARDAGVPVVVLDRPNPLGGIAIEGPVLDRALASFVGRYPLPVRHGLTTAELARWFNEVEGIGCDLRVVPMVGWRRRMFFDDTGLPWIPPSPNMPTLDTAIVYPGSCLVEGTTLSEGRGTARPFEQVGAPDLDGAALASRLRAEGLPAVLFRDVAFRPMFHKHAGRTCGGVFVHVRDRGTFRPFATYLVLLREARRLAPECFAWRSEAYEFVRDRPAIDLLLGREGLRAAIEAGAGLVEMESTWSADLARFARSRERFLLYPN